MPDLQPLVKRLDELICSSVAGLYYAIKWQKAYYGLPDRGWIVELVAYDVSVNVVFLGGADFADPPPEGTGPSRYIKLKSVAELKTSDIGRWIEEASRADGWK